MRIRLFFAACALLAALGALLFFGVFESRDARFHRLKKTDPHTCLALNIYWEAGALVAPPEPEEGLRMVGAVVMKRVSAGKRGGWPKDVCGVVWQKRKNGRRVTPEFSWTITGAADRIPQAGPRWELSQQIAREVLDGTWKPPADLACSWLYKRHDNKGVRKKNKKWFDGHTLVRIVGSHGFYCGGDI